MPKEKVKPRNLTKNDIYRRIDFILQEAKHRSPRDQTMTYEIGDFQLLCDRQGCQFQRGKIEM